MPPADGDLIGRIIQNDLNAFDELFNKYQNSVYRLVCYLTGNRNEADDLFQETWLRVVKYLPNSGNIKDFKAWIFTIAVNLHKDYLRKKQVRRFISIFRSDLPGPDNESSRQMNFDKALLTNDETVPVEIALALNQAITTLPIKQRQVFILKEIEGLKHAEISEILNAPIGTIKSLLHKAIKKLQQELSDFREG